jgi:hypothetical protein
MEYNLRDKVLYQDKEYNILWIYDSEYIEIAQGYSNIELVHKSEIKKIK